MIEERWRLLSGHDSSRLSPMSKQRRQENKTQSGELAVTAEDLRQILAAFAFARIYNFKLHSFAGSECTLDMPFQEAIERPGGIVSGSVFMTAADVAMWLAIMTLLGIEAMTVTTELNTAFLNSAR